MSCTRVAVAVVSTVLVVVMVAVLVGLVSRSPAQRGTAGPVTSAAPSGSPRATPTPPETGPDLLEVQGADAAARPREVRIPRLGLTSRLDDLAVVDDGTLERPPEWDVAGWYAGGPRPGDIGPAVIAGHVDSPDGPAVFTGLEALRAGDLVEVVGVDGSTVAFRVDRLASSPKDSFPTEAVYGQTPDAQLRLITCDGAYVADRGGYQDNLIVYATLVGG